MSNSELIGSSAKFRAVLKNVGLVAPVDSAVLIQGETGTGKEKIAQAIHEASSRRNSRFVSLNCAATRFAGFAEINGIRVIHGGETAVYRRFHFIFNNLQVAGVLLSPISRMHDVVAATGEGTMRSTRWAFRLSSKRCSTCEDLRRRHARSEAAIRNARNLYRAAEKTTDSAALQNLEEELKQTSAAHKLICYAVHGHLTNQHSQPCGVCLAAERSGKGVMQ